MEKDKNRSETIAEQFQALSNNLNELLRAAWNRPERVKLQDDIEAGLNELGMTLKKVTDDVQESELGQKLKSSVAEVKTKIEQGKIEDKWREELNQVLANINRELESFVSKLNKDESPNHTTDQSNVHHKDEN